MTIKINDNESFRYDESVRCRKCRSWRNTRIYWKCPTCYPEDAKKLNKIFKELQKEFGVKRL